MLCSWPHGKRPALPFVYSDEVWTGIEYQVAAHLIYEGLVMEGLAITKAVRDRYDGERRNPWNEFECGSHYARALASWSLLTALSGYAWSAPEPRLSFAPRMIAEDFRVFFTTGSGWGMFAQRLREGGATAAIDVLFGTLDLRTLAIGPVALSPQTRVAAAIGGTSVPAQVADPHGVVVFGEVVRIQQGDRLEITLGTPRAR